MPERSESNIRWQRRRRRRGTAGWRSQSSSLPLSLTVRWLRLQDIPLPRIDSFIPTMMAIVFVTDLVTAVLLFGQFSITGSRALLVLASGYLFSSLIAIPFALTFPGAFAPTGLLGAGPQSAAWLSVFFRFGFAAATVGYALLISGKHTKGSIELSPRPAIFWSVAIVIIVVCALTSAVTAGHDLMPRLLEVTAFCPWDITQME